MKLHFFVDETTNVGEATMPCVPHVGEEVHLWLSRAASLGGPPAAYFRVDRIQYVCLNTGPVVEWIEPYTQDSYEAYIYVTPLDRNTEAYVAQVKAYISN